MRGPLPGPRTGAVFRRRGCRALFGTDRRGFFGLRQGFEPIGDLVETFLAGGLGHARIHVGVLVGFARDRGFQIGFGGPHLETGGRVANGFQEFQMAVGVTGLTLGGRAENGRDVVVPFNIGLLGEIQIAAVGLAFAGERVFQVLLGFGAF